MYEGFLPLARIALLDIPVTMAPKMSELCNEEWTLLSNGLPQNASMYYIGKLL